MAQTESRSRTANGSHGLAALGVVGIAAAAAGAFLLSRSSRHPHIDTDAPHWTLDKKRQGERPVVGKTLLISAPRDKLFAAWQRVEEFPRFMENVEAVEKIGPDLFRWTIKGPGGSTMALVNRITEVAEGKYISWQSTADSDVANSGKVSFSDAPAGRGTYVSLVMAYDPPAGTIGRLFAKLFRREPAVQARHDLRRFKQWVETGEVTSNAGPADRSNQLPDQPHL